MLLKLKLNNPNYTVRLSNWLISANFAWNNSFPYWLLYQHQYRRNQNRHKISVTRAKNPKSAAYLPKIATFIAPIFKVHFFRPNSRPTNKCLFFMQSLAILWHFITWIVWYSNHLPISLRKLDGIWKKKYFSKILK